MAPKAAPKAAEGAVANPQAKAKAKRYYRTRVHVTAPAPVQRRNEQRQVAIQARPGTFYICPECAFPRFVPQSASPQTTYTCAMPRVPLPDSAEYRKCDFRTSVRAWRLRAKTTPAYAAVCKIVIAEVVGDIHNRDQAGNVECVWEAQCTELAQRVAAQQAAAA